MAALYNTPKFIPRFIVQPRGTGQDMQAIGKEGNHPKEKHEAAHI